MSPNGGLLVDSDTGEVVTPLVQTSQPLRSFGDDETGEQTQVRLVYQRSKFKVPRSALKSPVFDTAVLDSPKKGSEYVCDLSLLVLPMLVVLPGWATVVYIMAEVLYHSWMHAQRGRSLMVKTPMRIMFNAMCAECVAEKQMEKVGKLQDERTLRINSRRILSYNCSQFGCS
ncbi:uncharacterized protein LOC128994776 [Macrosteles quadrilineatus]|uniref:uncharacterized protein LOC128994588 n=1 Tax=Macrosteles quadrilineatus TaxID=74068 RepID=UPI0023E0B6F2|nr:uncharacterized protein LOC128994588 [Macrosteles quadrilineatus]XP_054275516.1 uncharacterized protein LOC128994776 [Macrosteles quadrilineatus]